ncbi:MAG: formimidoylglutamate deiminase [Chloroflexota bacterium]
MTTPTIQQNETHLTMPGFATAHSHAFQRALRGRTQRRAGSFWSWRGLMYELVEKLSPEDVFNISRLAFAELTMSGVTAVGEFHYVHHQLGGQPYEERITLAESVIQAAKAVGIRITLIRTAYLRGGYQQPMTPAQQRFSDSSLDPILQDVETINNRYAKDSLVQVALAAHSIRAVPKEQVVELADYAKTHTMPLHMHVAEQRREIEECVWEYNARPVEVLAEAGVLSPTFVAIHATHLSLGEIAAFGDNQAMICLCRTTERDLGDGLPETASLIEAGAKICVGVDSHATSDAFEEIRAVELDDRSRTETRTTAAEAPALLQMATENGYQAMGFTDEWQQDQVTLRAADPSLIGISSDLLADAVIFGATPRAVDTVTVNGQTIVEGGIHRNYDEIRQGYMTTMKNLGLL